MPRRIFGLVEKSKESIALPNLKKIDFWEVIWYTNI